MPDRSYSLLDLLTADSWAEARWIAARVEFDPVWLLAFLAVAVLIYFGYSAYSPMTKREPRRGTFYLGNVELGQNPKVEGDGKLKTRLHRDPEYEPDDDA